MFIYFSKNGKRYVITGWEIPFNDPSLAEAIDFFREHVGEELRYTKGEDGYYPTNDIFWTSNVFPDDMKETLIKVLKDL
ncbi:MAG: hypothetical protein IJI65_02565 [Lachnospiraceae bacterium]|nr:hypothetical protein [Lachnospiraceae bacterium]